MMRKMAAGVRVVGCVLGCAACCGSAGAQAQDVVSVYGYDFALIGDPGNRDTNGDEVPLFPEARIGGVDYEYRLATLEVTLGQYLEFVQAYYPYYIKANGGSIASAQLTGFGIRAAFGQVHIRPDREPDEPAEMGWEYAARYVNWLHHGKVVEDWAFETGVYDTSTFVQDDDGVWQHQEAHSPGARLWMPTSNEWIKAGYWDPAKDDGAGGYWRFPNGSDVEPLPGLPGKGGERNAGDSGDVFPLGVGSYPGVMSPWGMLDMAGGESEWMETVSSSGDRRLRGHGGSIWYEDHYDDIFSNDILGYYRVTSTISIEGLRLAAGVWAPADLNRDGRVNYFDVSVFARWFAEGDDRADLRDDGRLDIDDVRVYLGLAR